jgi:hypothetical protein
MLVTVPSANDVLMEMTPEMRRAYLHMLCEHASRLESLGSLIHHEINVPLRKIAQQLEFSLNSPALVGAEDIERWRMRLSDIASLTESLAVLCSFVPSSEPTHPALSPGDRVGVTESPASHA